MKAKHRGFVAVASVTVAFVVTGRLGAAEPGWTSRIAKLGEERARVNALEITERPYRPFHFYGNTVRRLRYRGNPVPTAEDWSNTIRYALRLDG